MVNGAEQTLRVKSLLLGTILYLRTKLYISHLTFHDLHLTLKQKAHPKG